MGESGKGGGGDFVITMLRRVLKRKITTPENFELPAKALKTFLQETVTPGYCYTAGAEHALSKVTCIFALYMATGAKALAKRENRKRILGSDVFNAVNCIELDHLMSKLNKVLPEYRKKASSSNTGETFTDQNMSHNSDVSPSAILDEVITIDSDSEVEDDEDGVMSSSSSGANDASVSDVNSNDECNVASDSDSDQLEIIDTVNHSGKSKNSEEPSTTNNVFEADNLATPKINSEPVSQKTDNSAQNVQLASNSDLQNVVSVIKPLPSSSVDEKDNLTNSKENESIDIVEVSEKQVENKSKETKKEEEEDVNVDTLEGGDSHNCSEKTSNISCDAETNSIKDVNMDEDGEAQQQKKSSNSGGDSETAESNSVNPLDTKLAGMT